MRASAKSDRANRCVLFDMRKARLPMRATRGYAARFTLLRMMMATRRRALQRVTMLMDGHDYVTTSPRCRHHADTATTPAIAAEPSPRHAMFDAAPTYVIIVAMKKYQ